MSVKPICVHDKSDYTLACADLSHHGFPFLPEVCRIAYRYVNDTPVEHVHPGRIEVIYLYKGRNLTLSAGGRQVVFPPGNCFISRPDEPHCIKTFPKGTKYYWFSLRTPGGHETLPGLTLSETRQLTKTLTNAQPRLFAGSSRLRDAFERILELNEARSFPSSLKKISMRAAALDLLMETAKTIGCAPLAPRKTVVDQLAADILAHPERDFPLPQIAADAGLSVSSLSSKFKDSTGTTPHAYLIDCRINRAKELLSTGMLPVTALARQLGFASYTQFSALFRSHVGICPAKFRKQATGRRQKSSPRGHKGVE